MIIFVINTIFKNMKFKVTEKQIKLINEVNKGEEFLEYSPEYTYTSIYVLLKDNDPNEIMKVYFNGSNFGRSDYRHPESNVSVYFNGPNGEFIFDSDNIHYTGINSPYIFGNKLNDEYHEKLLPLGKTNSKTNVKRQIKPYEIRKALKLAFPEYWVEAGNGFTPGLRGIHTIGEKIGTEESWSIMNYFDTKKEIKEKINQLYSNSKEGLDIVSWLTKELVNNDSLVKEWVERQLVSIKSGDESEKLAVETIGGDNVVVYPPGHEMDRYEGVDMTVDGVNYQIKPLKSYSGKKEGPYFIKTYGMGNYKGKPLVHKILFINRNKILIFDNKDYTHTFGMATFTKLPTKVINIK